MKKAKRIITIEIETERAVLLTHKVKSMRWCSTCNAEVQLISMAELRRLVALSREFDEDLDSHHFHLDRTAGGELVICLNSLLKNISKTYKEIGP